ncbi:MAG: hypothetical protein ABJK28_11820 [Algibacter sp.]
MRTRILIIILIGISLSINAQNTFPSSGNVGIGTTNPMTEFHIEGRMMLNQGVIQRGGTPITNTTDLGLYSHLSGHWIRIVSNNAPIRFFTDIANNGSGSNTRMTIESNGNVGIGTTTPSTPLFISGANQVESPSIPKVLAVADPSDITKTISLGYDKNLDAGVVVSVDSGTGWKNTLIQPYHGNVGIGTTNPGSWKLAVNGEIRAKEIKVETGWSDFVFYNNYKLPTLQEVENQIKEKGHLKDIPSAKEVKENGIFLGEMNSKLLQKIEELTLYTIQQEKQIKELNKLKSKVEKENESLKILTTKFLELQKRLEKLENK